MKTRQCTIRDHLGYRLLNREMRRHVDALVEEIAILRKNMKDFRGMERQGKRFPWTAMPVQRYVIVAAVGQARLSSRALSKMLAAVNSNA